MNSELKYFNENLIRPLPVGTEVNRHEIVRILSQDDSGTIYLCEDLILERKCLLKEYTPKNLACRTKEQELLPLLVDEFNKGLRTFIESAQMTASINHQSIVRIENILITNKTIYLVMEYEEGESLREIITRRKSSFEAFEVESLFLKISDVLDYLHKKYLIYRNLSPENIIIKPDGSLFLIGMNLTGNLNRLSENDSIQFEKSAYSPPELHNKTLLQGPWTDIYSLGAVLYELIAGVPPLSYDLRSTDDSFKCVADVGRGKYGAKILALIDRCILADYEDRFLSIEEMLEFFKTEKFITLRNIYHSISCKAMHHFLNWAKPNDGLFIDEFVKFILAFGIIDMTWRLGTSQLWNPILHERLVEQKLIDNYMKLMTDAGFNEIRLSISKDALKLRLDEYAATCLLDRQKKDWLFLHTREHCAKNCIKNTHSEIRESFMELMEGVVDNYRGRVKKELEKLTR